MLLYLSNIVFILLSNAVACSTFWKLYVWLHFWPNAHTLPQNPWLTSVWKLVGRMDLSAVLSFTDFTTLLPAWLQVSHFLQLLMPEFPLLNLPVNVKLEPTEVPLTHDFYCCVCRWTIASHCWAGLRWWAKSDSLALLPLQKLLRRPKKAPEVGWGGTFSPSINPLCLLTPTFSSFNCPASESWWIKNRSFWKVWL